MAKTKSAEPGLTRKQFRQTLSTVQPVAPADLTGIKPEFGRTKDLQWLYGIRRGTAYNLLAAGKIRGCVLRVRGAKSGVRLFDLASVREYIRHCQTQQEAA